jgi:2,3-diketo-5-methylthio-1-phosphopentane phosphatase
MSSPRYAVFCDFDGTVARRDVGYHLYLHFSKGRSQELMPGWKSGEISTRECLRLESEMFRGNEEEFFAFLEQFDLNPGFDEFVEHCRRGELDLAIISDGLDLYINFLLDRHGVEGVPVICNRAVFREDRLKVTFPYPAPDGEGVGKGQRIAEYRAQQSGAVTVIFVGDGLSDVGAMKEADIIFAKKDLRRYCDRENIAYTSFDTFHDVTAQLRARSIFTP